MKSRVTAELRSELRFEQARCGAIGRCDPRRKQHAASGGPVFGNCVGNREENW